MAAERRTFSPSAVLGIAAVSAACGAILAKSLSRPRANTRSAVARALAQAHPVMEAQAVLTTSNFDEALAFLTDHLGFRVHTIFPADSPQCAVLVGHHSRFRLERQPAEHVAGASPQEVRILCLDPQATAKAAEGAGGQLVVSLDANDSACEEKGVWRVLAPGGITIAFVSIDPPLDMPVVKPSFVLSRLRDGDWVRGRAGMMYRDLIPDRQGGRFIASHIHIPEGGPVPDYVHFHKVHFQMIFCYKGWVKVVYEDQGEPFVLRAGDCVLQPPEIRHRVLESSDNLEVVEIGCPAIHETFSDPNTPLPNRDGPAGRKWGGQEFVRFQASKAQWDSDKRPSADVCDVGIERASKVASVYVTRPKRGKATMDYPAHAGDLSFTFVLEGTATLDAPTSLVGEPKPLAAGDSYVIPAGFDYALSDCSDDLRLLEIALPALL